MSLRTVTFIAARWAAISTVLVAMIQLLQTSILARLLTQNDFGLMAVVISITAVLSILSDFGFSQAIIHFDNIPPDHLSSLFWSNALLSLLLLTALLLLSPLIGKLYGSEVLIPLLSIVGLIFPITVVGQQMRALAAKALQFDVLARIEIVSAVCACISAIISALLNMGVYAIAISVLINALTNSMLAWVLLPHDFRPRLHFRFVEIKHYLRFSFFLVVDSIAGSFQRNADVFLGGLVLGAAAIGVYSVPRDFSLRLSMAINSIVTRVGFPVMARVKSENERLKLIYLKTLRMTASVNIPLFIALGLFSPEFVVLLWGSEWSESVIYLQVLAGWGLIRSTGNPVGTLLYATGRTQRAFWWTILTLPIITAVYYLCSVLFGLIGLAVAAVCLQILMIIPIWFFLVRPTCGVELIEYLTQFLIPLCCGFVAALSVWLIICRMPYGVQRLAVGVTAGALIYLGLSWLFNRQWFNAMVGLIGRGR